MRKRAAESIKPAAITSSHRQEIRTHLKIAALVDASLKMA
jgi:hypothetical protein